MQIIYVNSTLMPHTGLGDCTSMLPCGTDRFPSYLFSKSCFRMYIEGCGVLQAPSIKNGCLHVHRRLSYFATYDLDLESMALFPGPSSITPAVHCASNNLVSSTVNYMEKVGSYGSEPSGPHIYVVVLKVLNLSDCDVALRVSRGVYSIHSPVNTC